MPARKPSQALIKKKIKKKKKRPKYTQSLGGVLVGEYGDRESPIGSVHGFLRDDRRKKKRRMYVGTRVTLPRHTSRDRKREKGNGKANTHIVSVVVGCRITKNEQK